MRRLQPGSKLVMIGINDVWRQFDLPLQPECHVLLPEYEQTLDELVATTLPTVRDMVLMTPYYIEPLATDAMRACMDPYGAAVKKVAAKRGALFVDTQAAFNGVLAHCHSAALAWDRVHPNSTGHMLLARTFLKAVGALR